MSTKTSRTTHKVRVLCLCLIGLIFALRCFTPYYSPDSFNYLAMARGLARGEGLAGNLIAVNSAVPRPLDLWPPAYPVALGVGLLLGLGPTKIAVLINFVAMLLYAWISLRMMREEVDGRYALVLGVLIVTYQPYLFIAQYVWSEPLMLALLTAALAIESGDRHDRTWRAVATGGLLGLATLARYAAVFGLLAIALGRTVDSRLYPQRRRRDLCSLAVIASCYGLTLLPWLLRNYLIFGKILGLPHADRPGGIRGGLGAVLAGAETLVGGATFGVLGLCGFVLGAHRLIVAPLANREAEVLLTEPPTRSRASRLLPLGIFPAVYGLGIFILAMRVNFDEINQRLLCPLGIGLLPLLAETIAVVLRERSFLERKRVCAGAALMILLVMLLPSGRLLLPRGLSEYRLAPWGWHIRWVEAHAGKGDLLIGHDIFFLEPFTAATVMSDGIREYGPLDQNTLGPYLRRESGRWRNRYWVSHNPCDRPPLPNDGFVTTIVAREGRFTIWRLEVASAPAPTGASVGSAPLGCQRP